MTRHRRYLQPCFLPFFWCCVNCSSSYSKHNIRPKNNKYYHSPIFGGLGFRFVFYPQQHLCCRAAERSPLKRDRKVVLISGATGCIGKQIWLHLMQHTKHNVKLIVRKDSLSKLDGELWKKYSHRSQVLIADLQHIHCLRNHLRDIDCAILAATSWGGEQAFQINVDATLQLVEWLPKDCHVLYFSTASIIDSDGCLLEEAFRYGTPYLQSKYMALQRLLPYSISRKITVLFPTLVVGPNSHLENAASRIASWKGLLERIYLDASAHFIHAMDAAKVITYLVDCNPKSSFYTWHPSNPQQKLPAFILGQPYFTADQLIQWICSGEKKSVLSRLPRIPILSVLPPFLLSRLLLLFGATVDPWVLYCLKKRHFVYPQAVAPENFGMVSQWRHISQLFPAQG